MVMMVPVTAYFLFKSLLRVTSKSKGVFRFCTVGSMFTLFGEEFQPFFFLVQVNPPKPTHKKP